MCTPSSSLTLSLSSQATSESLTHVGLPCMPDTVPDTLHLTPARGVGIGLYTLKWIPVIHYSCWGHSILSALPALSAVLTIEDGMHQMGRLRELSAESALLTKPGCSNHAGCRVGINRYNFLLESLHDLDTRYVSHPPVATV